MSKSEKPQFNEDEAKKFLTEREENEKASREKERTALLEKTISILKEEFSNSGVEVYLVGSILEPFQFYPHSDVDVVLKNWTRDRFDLWANLEEKIGRQPDIILFEKSRFQEFVLKHGLKVV